MYCLECQKITLRGTSCSNCGKLLPGYEPLPDNLVQKATQLKKLTVLVRCGDMSREDFRRWIDKQEDAAWSILDATEPDKIAADVKPTLAEEVRLGRQGAATLLESLECLRSWEATGANSQLDLAFSLCQKSDSLILKALELNRQAYRDVLAVESEFLRQRGVDF